MTWKLLSRVAKVTSIGRLGDIFIRLNDQNKIIKNLINIFLNIKNHNLKIRRTIYSLINIDNNILGTGSYSIKHGRQSGSYLLQRHNLQEYLGSYIFYINYDDYGLKFIRYQSLNR